MLTLTEVRDTLANVCNPLFEAPSKEVALEEGNMDPHKDQAHLDRVQLMANRVEAGMTPDGRGWEQSEDEDRKARRSAIFNL